MAAMVNLAPLLARIRARCVGDQIMILKSTEVSLHSYV